jgi:cell wall-associated NlpC family hydrolase
MGGGHRELDTLISGDLVFTYRLEQANPSHVGLYLGAQMVLSACFRKVVVEPLRIFIRPEALHTIAPKRDVLLPSLNAPLRSAVYGRYYVDDQEGSSK